MGFLFIAPSMIVPILLIILIILAFIAIIALSTRYTRERRRKMENEIKKMKELNTAVSEVKVPDLKIKNTKPVKKEVKSEREGDRTIYDDRKNLSDWQVHLSKTYRDMKKKNPNAKFSDAMEAAKKTYKKK